MQTYNVIITATAEFELNEYVDYIALDSIPNAVVWQQSIYNQLATLSAMAERCPIADESAFFSFDVRCMLIGEYRALYKFHGDTVEVLHIKHPRMNR